MYSCLSKHPLILELKTFSPGFITGLMKSGIRESIIVSRAMDHSPRGRETLPVLSTVCGNLSISIQLSGTLDTVRINQVRFRERRLRDMIVGCA
jgi:hypothetical protein